MGAGIPFANGDKISPLVHREIAIGACTDKVVVDLICTAGPATGLTKRLVNNKTDTLGQVHRPDEALEEAGLDKLLLAHHMILAKNLLSLALVELMVAGNYGDNLGTVLGNKGQGFAGPVLGEAKEVGNGLDGTHARSVNLFQDAVSRALGHRDLSGSGLVVSGESAVIAVDQARLASVRQSHKLDGGIAADLTGVGDYGQGLKAAALADAGIGVLHVIVDLLQALLRGGEGIAVLHDELAAAHEAEAGAHLIAELILDLIQVDGQLLIGTQLVLHQVGDGLLMCGSKNKLSVVAVLHAHELGAVGVPATALMPQAAIDHHGHKELLCPGGVHLVADDVLDLLERAPSQRQIAIQAGGLLADHTGAQ